MLLASRPLVMTDPSAMGGSDLEALEEQLKALSFSNRLKLLRLLRVPRTVDEIHLTPGAADQQGDPDRPLSREAVRHHLERLAEAGIVQGELTKQADGRTRKQYVLDEATLYSVAETLRRLSTRDAGQPSPRRTQDSPDRSEGSWPAPPRLLLVHGAPSRRAFGLCGVSPQDPRGWVIGRDPKADVTLEYDPYISGENTEILPTGDGYEVLSLRTARNETRVNEQALEPGESGPLEHGDVLGVGSSMLVFHTR